MTTGNNVDPLFLWILRVKTNTPDGGFNLKLHLPETSEADAKTRANKIIDHYKYLIPSTAEIRRATISRSNVTKDSRILTAGLGDGKYLQNDVDPDPTVYNQADDVIKVRFEDDDGGGVTMKIGPVPDTIIVGGEIPLAIASVTDVTAADPVPIVTDVVYATAFTQFMLLVAKYCARVEAKTNNPGGTYKFSKYKNAHVIGVGKKKGGRVFVK